MPKYYNPDLARIETLAHQSTLHVNYVIKYKAQPPPNTRFDSLSLPPSRNQASSSLHCLPNSHALSLSSPPIFLTSSDFSNQTASRSSKRLRFGQLQLQAVSSTAYNSGTHESSTSSYPSPYCMTSCASLYEILGIPAFASFHEIKTAYRQLARICHPDVAAPNSKDSSADEFIKIHAAYSTLSDPEKRADYDRKRLHRYRTLNSAATVSGFAVGYTQRNWETDQCW